jgi:NhaA family Na+:H+ antiporter
MIGLVLGKPIGIVGIAWLVARFTRASLSPGIAWRDVTAVGFLAGVGFTVALLISELGYSGDELLLESAKIAVLVASVIAATIAAFMLLSRGRHYAEMAEIEKAEQDQDAISSGHQAGEPESGPQTR